MVSFKIPLILVSGLSMVFGGSVLANGIFVWILANFVLGATLTLLGGGGGLVMGGSSGYSLLHMTSPLTC